MRRDARPGISNVRSQGDGQAGPIASGQREYPLQAGQHKGSMYIVVGAVVGGPDCGVVFVLLDHSQEALSIRAVEPIFIKLNFKGNLGIFFQLMSTVDNW